MKVTFGNLEKYAAEYFDAPSFPQNLINSGDKNCMNCSPTNLVGIETKGAMHTSSPGSPVFNILDDYDSYKDYDNDYDS